MSWLCALWCLAAQPLVRNGGFEQGLAGWTVPPGLAQVGKAAVEQDPQRGKVLRLQCTADAAEASITQTIQLRPGASYALECFCRSTSLRGTAGAVLLCLDAQGQVAKRLWLFHVPTWGYKPWTRIWAPFTAPKGVARYELRLAVYCPGTIWIDDIKIAEHKPQPLVREGPPASFGFDVRAIPTPRPTYCLAVARERESGEKIFIGDIDGRLWCLTPDGKPIWSRDLGGLCFQVAPADLDGDGKTGAVACTADADGAIQAFDEDARLLWRYCEPGAVFRWAAAGDLDGDGRDEVVAVHENQMVALDERGRELWRASYGGPHFKCVDIADVDGDGKPDAVASLTSQRLFAAALSSRGRTLWLYKPVRFSRLRTEDVQVADVDRDGRAEVLIACNAGLVLCVRDGQTVWAAGREKRKLRPWHRDVTGHYASQRCHIVAADFLPDRPGLETLVALPDVLWLLDSQGRRVWEGKSGVVIRALACASPQRIYLPSGTLRDSQIYCLTPRHDGQNPLSQSSAPNPIYAQLDRLYARIHALQPRPNHGVRGQFYVLYAASWPTRWRDGFKRLEQTCRLLKSLESDALKFIVILWPKDLPVELHRGGVMERREIMQTARFMERIGQPFVWFACHGCAPNLSLEALRATLQAAPTTFRGIYVAENMSIYPRREWWDFVTWLRRAAQICARRNGLVIMKEMYDTWAFLPADPRIRRELFAPEMRRRLVAIYATNNPIAPEVQIAAMIGLKHAGLIADWGISAQYWNWSWEEHTARQANWSICPADVIMRMDLYSACLGGHWFHIEGGQEYLKLGAAELSDRARRHREIVFELIRKRLLLPVPDGDILSFSPVVLVRRMHPAAAELASSDSPPKLGSPLSRPVGPLRRGLLGLGHPLQTARPDYFGRIAYGSRRYLQTMFPPLPYGLVRIVPHCPEGQRLAHDGQAIATDGEAVFANGRRLTGQEAAAIVTRALQQAAQRLPVRCAQAAAIAHRIGSTLRIFVIDPGYMCPAGPKARIILGFKPHSATDALTGDRVPVHGTAIEVTVPAGAFRVIDVQAP